MNPKPVPYYFWSLNDNQKIDWMISSRVKGFPKLYRELVYETRNTGSSQAECGSIPELAEGLNTPFVNFMLRELDREESHIGWLDRSQQTFMVHSMVGLAYAYEKYSPNKIKNVVKRVKNSLKKMLLIRFLIN